MNPFRSIIRKVHLLLGLSSGIVIFIVAITGCIYAFEEEIRSYLYRDLLFVNVPNKSDQKVSIDVLVDSVKKHYPKQVIKNIRFKNGDNSSVEVVFTTKESLYIHPYTKEVLGVVNKDKDFFGIVLKVHRSLYLGEPGKMIT
ncbi:MAG TPA: PepSY-associated TM helix domain-containing protein, partial [Bacteroidia bacterium]|nr:PepSY-associated TM helix domain-containing protein [Bacteroidia bacterium]